MKLCDLHLHSTYSDGTFTPEEVVDLALKANLSAIALTDHNMIEGNFPFFKAAEGKIDVLAGSEFTTSYEGQELHLIGLFLNPDDLKPFEKILSEQLKRKEISNQETITALAQDGYDVSYNEFISLFGTGAKNRVHIAQYLIQKGIIQDKQEAFDGLLSKKNQYYKEPDKLDFLTMVKMIRETGGVSIWAHPLFHVNKERFLQILPHAVQAGLDGFEVLYTLYDEEETKFMIQTCQNYSLLPSGGSDFHGANKKDVFIGVGHGNLKIPYQYYLDIKNLLLERKKKRIIILKIH